jgi:hypothetical protein
MDDMMESLIKYLKMKVDEPKTFGHSTEPDSKNLRFFAMGNRYAYDDILDFIKNYEPRRAK